MGATRRQAGEVTYESVGVVGKVNLKLICLELSHTEIVKECVLTWENEKT